LDFSFAILIFFVGPCLGSFASAMAHRAPMRKSWIFASAVENPGTTKSARSACPYCGGQLGLFDLIPILSWLFLKGRCRLCKKSISPLYPILEMLGLVLSLALLYMYDVSAVFFLSLLALPFLLALLVISARGQRLPSQLLGIVFAIAVVTLGVQLLQTEDPVGYALDHVAGLFVYAVFGLLLPLLRVKIYKVRTEAAGEVALLAIAGLWLGLSLLPVFLILSGLYGMAAAVARIVLQRSRQLTMSHAFVAAFILTMIAGGQIAAWFI
jgi:leader peptidase (prepilin peptidase)/N-methyltransferase